MNEGRAYFDSLLTETDEVYAVDQLPTKPDEPKGHWVQPHTKVRGSTLLYFHGGGYTFYPEVSKRMADMMADKFDMEVFVADYRLTPENPHPAQIEDALAAYTYLLAKGKNPNQIVLVGD
ncbi:MAG: alpha/beta hydrolase, partial [Parvibaculaceae bacterium]|nr:alpha/beta hydrolase [Parvibaculaceae bacterium]